CARGHLSNPFDYW
nr:immunoglobulin heavy chain junction region [Macaca mulatta]MOV90242.1 immunoglobulin heavy chain junction region [Macaca mulatta]MOV90497.1 immunoglobulin heavy chain junction region [Macaca mulatta]MOV90561.1 immunoglobulin heavy chain junction region [Macaca mulatta]MOV90800.1 immunoglobulin heavy chain junction region [Macaca mulatta]